jgi:hypothetical protein|tara:strand:+ start:831 stop:1127 length:297 start_codon:yes stop_codon:yes gene_type:complete
MKFFKIAVYVLFAISFLNLSGSLYMYKGIMEKSHDIRINLPQGVMQLPEDSKQRDSQIFQAILMLHHKAEIHKPGSQQFCPICDAQIQTIESITEVKH